MKKAAAVLTALVLVIACLSVFAAAEDTDVLAGLTYTADAGNRTGGYGDFQDDGVTCKYLLTDGTWSSNGDANVAGYDSATVNFVFDLGGEKTDLYKFVCDGFGNSSWGIGDPVSVEFLVSDDGENYTSVGVIEAASLTATVINSWNQYIFELDLTEAVSAKFVKVIYNGTGFTWPSEMAVYQQGEDVAPVESDNPAAPTSDSGIIALSVIAALALAGAVIVKKSR